jgi:hypothetical protein
VELAVFDGHQNPVHRDSSNNPLLQLDLQRFGKLFLEIDVSQIPVDDIEGMMAIPRPLRAITCDERGKQAATQLAESNPELSVVSRPNKITATFIPATCGERRLPAVRTLQGRTDRSRIVKHGSQQVPTRQKNVGIRHGPGENTSSPSTFIDPDVLAGDQHGIFTARETAF